MLLISEIIEDQHKLKEIMVTEFEVNYCKCGVVLMYVKLICPGYYYYQVASMIKYSVLLFSNCFTVKAIYYAKII